MTSQKPPVCHYCKHRRPGYFVCDAYPDGIPDDITFRGALHEKPREGDHGIQFEAIDDDAQRLYEIGFKNPVGVARWRLKTGL